MDALVKVWTEGLAGDRPYQIILTRQTFAHKAQRAIHTLWSVMTQSFNAVTDGSFTKWARIAMATRALETTLLLFAHGSALRIARVGSAARSWLGAVMSSESCVKWDERADWCGMAQWRHLSISYSAVMPQLTLLPNAGTSCIYVLKKWHKQTYNTNIMPVN